MSTRRSRAVFGTYVEALCGFKFPVTKVAKPGSPICPACKEIYDNDDLSYDPDPS